VPRGHYTRARRSKRYFVAMILATGDDLPHNRRGPRPSRPALGHDGARDQSWATARAALVRRYDSDRLLRRAQRHSDPARVWRPRCKALWQVKTAHESLVDDATVALLQEEDQQSS